MTLPQSICSKWPVWCTASDSKPHLKESQQSVSPCSGDVNNAVFAFTMAMHSSTKFYRCHSHEIRCTWVDFVGVIYLNRNTSVGLWTCWFVARQQRSTVGVHCVVSARACAVLVSRTVRMRYWTTGCAPFIVWRLWQVVATSCGKVNTPSHRRVISFLVELLQWNFEIFRAWWSDANC